VEFYSIFRLSSSDRVCSTQGDIRTMHKILAGEPPDNSPVGGLDVVDAGKIIKLVLKK
jgi:hypothetical protein